MRSLSDRLRGTISLGKTSRVEVLTSLEIGEKGTLGSGTGVDFKTVFGFRVVTELCPILGICLY